MAGKKISKSILVRGYQKYFHYNGSYHYLIMWAMKNRPELYNFIIKYVNVRKMHTSYDYSLIKYVALADKKEKRDGISERVMSAINSFPEPQEALEMYNFHRHNVFPEIQEEQQILALVNDQTFNFSFQLWVAREKNGPLYTETGIQIRY